MIIKNWRGGSGWETSDPQMSVSGVKEDSKLPGRSSIINQGDAWKADAGGGIGGSMIHPNTCRSGARLPKLDKFAKKLSEDSYRGNRISQITHSRANDDHILLVENLCS